MIAAAGVVVFLRPEWLGLRVDFKPIEVVKVARPRVIVDLRPPEIPKVTAQDPGPVIPPGVAVTPTIVDPGPDLPPDVVAPDPVVDPTIQPDPIVSNPVAQANPDDPGAIQPIPDGPLQVGEFLSIGDAESANVIEPMVSGKRVDIASLQPGSEAFAQLAN